MADPFLKIKEQAGEFGNHNRKYVHTIARYKDKLIERLERKGKLDQVHLWTSAPNFLTEMETILAVGGNRTEKLNFLGCYYALQFLIMNLRAIDVLKLNLASHENRLGTYKQFMRRSGDQFRALTASYIARLLDVFLAPEERPEFVICGVGTKSDQDDIDVGIIDDGSSKRVEFNRAIGRMNIQMLKYASRFHFYLSEHVGQGSYSASIGEYKSLLHRQIRDFIIVTEMLGAARILGSEALFEEFEHEVTRRYFYQPGKDNKYHEGYLREVLGEIKVLCARPISSTRIHAKDDGLRLIKSLITAQKTIFGIDKVNAWDIIAELAKRNPQRKELYAQLDESLTFLEIFRYLYQLFVVQEEEIYLHKDRNMPQNLQVVAKIMGYGDVGVINARDHLLVHYYEHIRKIREIIPILVQDLRHHLRANGVLAAIIKNASFPQRYQGNLAVDFVIASSSFHGSTFWEDFTEALSENNGLLLTRFARDLNFLDREAKAKTIAKYMDWINCDLQSLVRLMVMMAKSKKGEGRSLFDAFNSVFLNRIRNLPNRTQVLVNLFYTDPRLINDYLAEVDDISHQTFSSLLDGEVREVELVPFRKGLETLCNLHSSNRYFTRFLENIVDRYPQCLADLHNTAKLKELSQGILGEVATVRSFKKKKEKLGDYYDLEFLRVGLQTLQGAKVAETNAEFTDFSDNYIQVLFDICKQEVDNRRGYAVPTDDLLAIYAAGGRAREQAYDDDYDIIVIINSTSELIRDYATEIVSKMNSEIIKRGASPHYRFAQRFGSYVITMEELARFLRQGKEDDFIDKSQILGSRLIVGSREFERNFEEKIIRPYIFNEKSKYIQRMIAEIKSRHRHQEETGILSSDIKECRGGLRDIEMLMLIYKAKYAIREPISGKLFERLAEIDRRNLQKFLLLGEALDFLRGLRDLFRLRVTASDSLRPELLDSVAAIGGFNDSKSQKADERLFTIYRRKTRDVHAVIVDLIRSFEADISLESKRETDMVEV